MVFLAARSTLKVRILKSGDLKYFTSAIGRRQTPALCWNRFLLSSPGETIPGDTKTKTGPLGSGIFVEDCFNSNRDIDITTAVLRSEIDKLLH